MQNSVIDEIYKNEYDAHAKSEKANGNLIEKASKAYDELIEALTEEQKVKFDNFLNLDLDEQCQSNADYFKRGVKFGVLIMAECMFD